MQIHITSGTGEGRTPLAAFHNALQDAGIAGYNIIQLSSVIPPGAAILEDRMSSFEHGTRGDRLYCVLARADARRGKTAYAGMGWASNRDGGLIVEHVGETREALLRSISLSLDSMCEGKLCDFDTGVHVTQVTSEELPACTVVAAVFGREAWSGTRQS